MLEKVKREKYKVKTLDESETVIYISHDYYIKTLLLFIDCLKINMFLNYLCTMYSYLLPDYGHSRGQGGSVGPGQGHCVVGR
jgi:predicted transcriptional regulator of viral defense system